MSESLKGLNLAIYVLIFFEVSLFFDSVCCL